MFPLQCDHPHVMAAVFFFFNEEEFTTIIQRYV